jgi:hypothetical protein
MKTILKYSLPALGLLLLVAPNAHAGPRPSPTPPPPPAPQPRTAPEIDPALAVTGLALLAGSLFVARARRSQG